MHVTGKRVASSVPVQGMGGCGSRQRASPTGGAANGMLLKTAWPDSMVPRTDPPVMETTGAASWARTGHEKDRPKNAIAPIRCALIPSSKPHTAEVHHRVLAGTSSFAGQFWNKSIGDRFWDENRATLRL